MPLGPTFEHQAAVNDHAFLLLATRARNAWLVFITDHESGVPALGTAAVSTPTRLPGVPIVASALPFSNAKQEILAKAIAETCGKKLATPVLLFLDVNVEVTDVAATRTLKVAAGDLCDKMLARP